MADIIVVGAGLSGSLAAIMLSRRGFQVTIVDRYLTYPAELRAEQIVGSQLRIFDDLGLSEKLFSGVRLVSRVRNVRLGKQLTTVLASHYGMPYQDIVHAVRGQIPGDVRFIVGRVTDIDTGSDPVVHLDNGQTVAAKLVIMATGLNTTLSKRLGVHHQTISAQHSTTVAFDILLPKCAAGDTPILVYYGNGLQDRIDYLTIFPCKGVLRGNLFVYRDPLDPWVRQFRRAPLETLLEALPVLRDDLGEFSVEHVQCRASDVAVVRDHQRDGVVYIGDAYQTPCPAAGTGIGRLAVDVERLAFHVTRWFAANDLSVSSLQSYYNDPVKCRSDRKALKSAQFRRSVSMDPALRWAVHRQNVKAKRFAKYVLQCVVHAGLDLAAYNGRSTTPGRARDHAIQQGRWLLWGRKAERAGAAQETGTPEGAD